MHTDEPPALSKKIVSRLHESPSSQVYTTTLLDDESNVVVVKRTKITGPNGACTHSHTPHTNCHPLCTRALRAPLNHAHPKHAWSRAPQT